MDYTFALSLKKLTVRRILVSQFLTTDGIMESPEKWNLNYLNDREVVEEILADFSGADLLLFGKTTFEFFAARWPSRSGVMADNFNNIPKVVVSATLKKAEWNNASVINASAMAEIKKLKEQPGKNILVLGSHGLVQELIKEKLVDQYKLYIYPLTLGYGKRLFEDGTPAQKLQFITAKQFASGVISVIYQTEN